MWDIVELKPQDDSMLTDGSYGYTDDNRNIIVLNVNQPQTKKKVTVFHELLHAARFTFDTGQVKKRTYEEWEHHFIGVWENSMLMILRDNPELTKWLLGDK